MSVHFLFVWQDFLCVVPPFLFPLLLQREDIHRMQSSGAEKGDRTNTKPRRLTVFSSVFSHCHGSLVYELGEVH